MLPAVSNYVLGTLDHVFGSSFSPPTPAKVAETLTNLLNCIQDDEDSCELFCNWLFKRTSTDIEHLTNILKDKPNIAELFEKKMRFITHYFNKLYESFAVHHQYYWNIDNNKINVEILDQMELFNRERENKITLLVYLLELCGRCKDYTLRFEVNEFKNHFDQLDIFSNISKRVFHIQDLAPADFKDPLQTYCYFGAMGLEYFDAFNILLGTELHIIPNAPIYDKTYLFGLLLKEIELATLERLIEEKIYNPELLRNYLVNFLKNNTLDHFVIQEAIPRKTSKHEDLMLFMWEA